MFKIRECNSSRVQNFVVLIFAFSSWSRKTRKFAPRENFPLYGTCTLDEYLCGDSDIPICKELDTASSAGWEEAFLAQLQEEEGSESDKDDNESDNEDLGDSIPPVKLNSLKEVIQCVEDAQQFLEHRGHLEHALRIGQSVDDIVFWKTTSAKHSSICDYLTK